MELDAIKLKECIFSMEDNEIIDTDGYKVHNCPWMQSFPNGIRTVKHTIAFISKRYRAANAFGGITRNNDTNYYLAVDDYWLQKHIKEMDDEVIVIGRGEDQFHLEFPYYVTATVDDFDDTYTDFDCALNNFEKIEDMYVAWNSDKTQLYIHSDKWGLHYAGY